jgi:hypothetical protein
VRAASVRRSKEEGQKWTRRKQKQIPFGNDRKKNKNEQEGEQIAKEGD